MSLTTDDIQILKQMFRESEGRVLSEAKELISESESRVISKATELISKSEERLTKLIELNRDSSRIEHERKFHTDRIT